MISKDTKKELNFLKKMFSMPPQTTLGIQKILKIDPLTGEAEVKYRARKNMCHSGNIVQGGFITGWLDAVMALACMGRVGANTLVLSLEIKTTFIRKVLPKPVIVSGKVIKAGKSIAFLEGEIIDEENNILAKGNQTVKLISNFYNNSL
ncbi:MAG: hypothetical protein CFH34_01013 [Alphaproteobacteria bacterium MarineAlpha9_Bin4]|nr:thioesterase [Pelagibacterales bacterium]PPR26322.1 MAG: hypothetical protein CFH34_01013 [Alphaproteobacteria bacterium MarineAlpha9_Bin4]|tara:strand:+ start:24 stop:470 length:447 start_codon:yes stop_codon:yes gene_type:complete